MTLGWTLMATGLFALLACFIAVHFLLPSNLARVYLAEAVTFVYKIM